MFKMHIVCVAQLATFYPWCCHVLEPKARRLRRLLCGWRKLLSSMSAMFYSHFQMTPVCYFQAVVDFFNFH